MVAEQDGANESVSEKVHHHPPRNVRVQFLLEANSLRGMKTKSDDTKRQNDFPWATLKIVCKLSYDMIL